MLEVNIPQVLAELTAAFEAYERTLITNDVAGLNRLFWDSPHTLRYGTREYERLYSHADIAEFRLRRTRSTILVSRRPIPIFRRSSTLLTTMPSAAGCGRTLERTGWEETPTPSATRGSILLKAFSHQQPDSVHNQVSTREELRAYGAQLYALIAEYFAADVRACSCHAR